eukprot:9357884-Pyramimonas_sp.AAC.1
MQWCRQGLGEQVDTVVLLGCDVEELHCPLGHPISNEVLSDVNMLGSGIVNVVLRDESCTD